MKYRKKPVVIEAVQFLDTKEGIAEVLRFCPSAQLLPWAKDNGHTMLRIKTWEGIQPVSPGDWIINGVKGEFYPCKDDVFRLTYEPVVMEVLR